MKIGDLLRSPWLERKISFQLPCTIITYDTTVTQHVTRSIYFSLKPYFNIIFLRKNHSTLSYAFNISNFKALKSFLPCFFFFHEMKNLKS